LVKLRQNGDTGDVVVRDVVEIASVDIGSGEVLGDTDVASVVTPDVITAAEVVAPVSDVELVINEGKGVVLLDAVVELENVDVVGQIRHVICVSSSKPGRVPPGTHTPPP
jgi:hypothetical protein